MINLGIAAGGIVFGYGLFKGKMQSAEDRASEHERASRENQADTERRMSAQFKRIDILALESANIKAKMNELLTLQQAEAKFVSKTELMLHMKNLELVAENTNGRVEKIEGKLEDILEILSNRRGK